jgi:transcriptional regulator with GAF, ATPase, and Fis domain
MSRVGESPPYIHCATPKEAAVTIVRAALEEVPEAGFGGLSTVDGHRVTNLAATDPTAVELDILQSQLGEGPSLSGHRSGVFLVPDLASVENWPRWSEKAMQLGVSSVLTYILGSDDKTIGALNLYSTSASAFAEVDPMALTMLAHQAAILVDLSQAHVHDLERISQLEEAIKSRDVIGQAKGILMEREGCSADEAFDMLRIASQHLNRKLRDVASDLVAQTQRDTRSGQDQKR